MIPKGRDGERGVQVLRAIAGHVALKNTRATRICALNLHDNAESTRANRIEQRRRDLRQGRREKKREREDWSGRRRSSGCFEKEAGRERWHP